MICPVKYKLAGHLVRGIHSPPSLTRTKLHPVRSLGAMGASGLPFSVQHCIIENVQEFPHFMLIVILYR
jgi:hypothetical protein